MKCLVVLLAVVAAVIADEETVVEITKEDFEARDPDLPVFIKFFAPWCGHCKRLAPTWEELAEKFNVDDQKVVIGKVDCTVETSLCSDNGVTGYPTLKFFNKEGEDEKYKGGRDLAALEKFVLEKLGGDAPAAAAGGPAKPNNGLYDLTADNFDAHIATGGHFIKFFAPWCGHCKRLAPTWEELAQKYASDSNVKIGKVDCTVHQAVCQKFEVRGYPTLLFIKDGKLITNYRNKFEVPKFEDFLERVRSVKSNILDLFPSMKVFKPVFSQCDADEDLYGEFVDNDEKYSGARDLSAFDQFIAKKSGKEAPKKEEKPAEEEEEEEKKEEPAEGLMILTADNIKEVLGSEATTFVKFYAPWCGHCKNMAADYIKLAAKYANAGGIQIAEMDCTAADTRGACSDYDVKGFPTLKIFRAGEEIGHHRTGRDVAAMSAVIEKLALPEQLKGVAEDTGKEEEKAEEVEEDPDEDEDDDNYYDDEDDEDYDEDEDDYDDEDEEEDDDDEYDDSEQPGLAVLNDATFDVIAESGKTVFAKFYAPWCGHCKRLAPDWAALAKLYKDNDDVVIAKVDCTENREVCGKYGVRGYPTLKLIRDGKDLGEHNGARSVDAMKAFVESNLGGKEEEEKEKEEKIEL